MGVDTVYQTDDIGFAALLLMVFGPEALTGIEILPNREKLFKFEEVPKFDCEAYKIDFDSAEGLAISSAKAYIKSYFSLTSRLKEMNQTHSASWQAARGERWWMRAREQRNAIVALREEYLKKKLSR